MKILLSGLWTATEVQRKTERGKRKMKAILLFLLLGLCMSPALGQQTSRWGRVAGAVVDKESTDQAPIEKVLVTFQSEAGRKFTTKTNKKGEFDAELPDGTFSMTLSKEGFESFTVSPVRVVKDTIQKFKVIRLLKAPDGATDKTTIPPDLV